jgi:hypothetical protein
MAKKGLKADDLLDIISQDERILELLCTRLKKILMPAIREEFVELTATQSTELKKTIEKSSEDLIAKFCNTQSQRITDLELENQQLKSRLDEVENITRQDNLVIYGLRETVKIGSQRDVSQSAQQDTLQSAHQVGQSDVTAILDLCNISLGLQVRESDISFTYRINGKTKGKERPVLVRFVNRTARNAVYTLNTELTIW